MSNTSAASLVETLGAKRIAEHVGVGQASVSTAKRGIPARWYPVIRDLCEADGIGCPEDAFNWVKAGAAL